MSSRDLAEARRLFGKRLGEAAGNTVYATVEQVDENKRTCRAKVGGVVYDNVLLYAIEDGALKGGVAIPRVGSGVLISRIAASGRYYVEMFSEIDKVVVEIDTTLVSVTAGGVCLSRGSAGLKKTLADLCDAIGQLTVTTGVGPSGVPINIAQFEKIKQELNQYLED